MRTINVGLVAHVDAGKTTLTEQLLYRAGQLRSPGSVDRGDTQTDFLEIERRRGISVQAAVTSFQHRGARINLIDAPGHADFLGEVEQSLSVLSLAVLVLSAVEGVQAQTRVLWRALTRQGIPTILFLNKVDRVGSDVRAVLNGLAAELGAAPLPLTLPGAEGSRACQILPAPREDLLLAAADFEPSLAEAVLEDRPVPDQVLYQALLRGIRAGTLLPALCGSAMAGKGVGELLDLVAALATEPENASAPLSARVFKVEADRTMGKVAHVRLYAGTVRARDGVLVQRTGQREKVTQVRRYAGSRFADIGSAAAGDIAALCGLGSVRVGDCLGETPLPDPAPLSPALLSVPVLPLDQERRLAAAEAAARLTEENPRLNANWDAARQSLRVDVSGPIQMEVLQAQFQDRFNVSVRYGEPTILYRETPLAPATGFEAYTMPKPCWAVVELLIEPLPTGSGYRFESVVADRDLLPRYQNHVQASLLTCLEQGLRGFPVTDLKVTLVGGQHHLIHTHPLDFFVATPMAFLDGLAKCGTRLLEPMLSLRLTGPEERLGRVMGEIIAMRGRVETSSLAAGRFTLCAAAPLATALHFPETYAALVSGQGLLESSFLGYEPAPPEVEAALPRRGVDPRDRAKWILHARSAL